MKKLIFLITVVFFTIALPATAQEIERSYEIFVPDDAPADEALPLLMVLHGAGGDGTSMARMTGFSDIAAEEHFIVVYPDGISGRWDYGAGIQTPSGTVHVDDVAFLTSLIDEADALHPVDRGRVFVTGFSDGATMTYTLGCAAPETFAAIAGVAAPLAMPIAEACNDAPPLSFLLIHGTHDPILRWDRYVAENGQIIALSAPESAAYWIGHNGCNPDTLTLTESPDLDSEDDSIVRVIEAADCEDDTAVIFYGIEGGGHTWPGHPIQAPFPLGPTNMDIDASHVIWEWFAARPSISTQ